MEASDDVSNSTKIKPEPVENVKPSKQNMAWDIFWLFIKKASLLFLGYFICHLNMSLILPLLMIGSLVWLEMNKSSKIDRISSKSKAISMTKKDILKVIDELPAWVTFPDRERAEWLNEIILQLWPSISNHVIKHFRGPLQTKIRKKFESFRFGEIDFGTLPLKIDGVKVYNRSTTKDSIIIDFDIYYDGDCDINFSMSGTQIGRIRDFQLAAELRVVLKPLTIKLPIVGGIQIFFLNTPDINFELDGGISGIPGFSYFIRQKIEQRITKKLVYPNKITKRFSKSVQAAELKSLEPEGVLRVHVFEAKDLERKDVTGKSDPYVLLNVGAQERKTHVVKRELNPKWDYWCEFIILDPVAQHLQFMIFDQDLNEDDFLGNGVIEIKNVIKENENDKWFNLDNAKHGKIHLRFTWLGLSTEYKNLETAIQETKQLKVADISTALLTVYIDSALNLPSVKSHKKPDPYVILSVGKQQEKTKIKKHTKDPVWEQGFSLLVPNPDKDCLIISIIDKQTDIKIDQLVYHIVNLTNFPDLQISKEEFKLPVAGKIIISLQLRILTNEYFEDEESDSDSDEEFSRHNSFKRTSSKRITSTTTSLSEVEGVIQAEKNSLLETVGTCGVTRSPSFRVKPDLGQIELTLFYSQARQKLIVSIHKIINLPLKDPSDIPDPYVKLKLVTPETHSIKNKTKVIIDSCDPVFEETFEYLLTQKELSVSKLILTIKSKKIFFNSHIIGQVIINFRTFHDLEESYREWFELTEASDSD